MTKRNPTAASLAKPQYRQRVIDVDRGYERRQLRDKIGEAFGASLAYLEDERAWCDRMEDDERYGTVGQLEGWQEPLRQMEG